MELLGVTFALLLSGGAIEMPPSWADHRPTRPYELKIVDQATMDKLCPPVLIGRISTSALGCTDLATRQVWIVEGLPLDDAANVLRHEEGHLNGWLHE